jgi:hypothetical protein
VDMNVFYENRNRFSLQELAKYRGRYVAWSPDGSGIIASDEDELRLDDAIRAAGYDVSETVVSFIPDEDTILGGGISE